MFLTAHFSHVTWKSQERMRQKTGTLSLRRWKTRWSGEMNYLIDHFRKRIGWHICWIQGNLASSTLLAYPSFWTYWEIRQKNKTDKHQTISFLNGELDIWAFYHELQILIDVPTPKNWWEFLLLEEHNRRCAAAGQPVHKRKCRRGWTAHAQFLFSNSPIWVRPKCYKECAPPHRVRQE